MAIPARQGFMLAFQHIAGLLMIEISFAIFPKDQCKIFAIMLAVTGSAQLLFFCHDERMNPSPALQPLRNGNVAVEAFDIARLLADFVTCQALGYAFKLGMCHRQRPG